MPLITDFNDSQGRRWELLDGPEDRAQEGDLFAFNEDISKRTVMVSRADDNQGRFLLRDDAPEKPFVVGKLVGDSYEEGDLLSLGVRTCALYRQRTTPEPEWVPIVERLRRILT